MRIDFSQLSPSERYHVMTQVIIPRPIAWVLTENSQGTFNLAPFSYFNAMASDPPLVMLSIGKKEEGVLKDTRRNIVERQRAVIHVPHEDDAEAVTNSAASLDYGESEIVALGLNLVDEPGWPLPRLSACRVAMACCLYDMTEIGPQQQGIIFCQIDDIYVADDAAQKDAKGRLKIDANTLRPLARLGASEYATFGDVFTIQRPK